MVDVLDASSDGAPSHVVHPISAESAHSRLARGKFASQQRRQHDECGPEERTERSRRVHATDSKRGGSVRPEAMAE